MRRLAFLAAASLGLGLTAFQPASFADCRDADCLKACNEYLANKDKNNRCKRSCDNPTKKYNQMSDKEQKQWVACITGCDKKFPLPRTDRQGEMKCGMRGCQPESCQPG